MYKIKTKMTITVDSEVKKEIQNLAKRMWANVSVLTNMFFVSAINTGSVHYYDSLDDTWEKLYKQYIESNDNDKIDAFSINNKWDKKDFFNKLDQKLWN
jgi:antitoxin component of RelBE/YafQ-DinJ toxin-antitoxin module